MNNLQYILWLDSKVLTILDIYWGQFIFFSKLFSFEPLNSTIYFWNSSGSKTVGYWLLEID